MLQYIFTENRIVFETPAADKETLFGRLVSLLEEPGQLSRAEILAALLNRERQFSTAVGNGIAIPHAKLDGLREALGVIAIVKPAMEYDSEALSEVSLVFMLLSPTQNPAAHLQTLKLLASVLEAGSLKQDLMSATDSAGAWHALRLAVAAVKKTI
ncbi:MAG: PTS sugar transporter subunit IIA [Spirochaetes bacterium]|nr:PTS sugar transporter subunit IIA [Spirochaetota bacterium]